MRAAQSSFPELLRQHRKAVGLTLQEVAGELDIDFSLVSKWERGERKPDRDQVMDLARVLGVPEKGLLTAWLRDAVLYAVGDDELALDALKAAETQVAWTLFNKQDRNAIIRKLRSGLGKFPKVRKAWLFGSFARKDDKPGSDIDLAIEVQDPFSYFDLAEVQHQLEQLVGRKVDVGFMDTFRPHVRARIEPDLRLIHER